MRKLFFVMIVLVLGVSVTWAAGMKKKKALPYEFGAVTMNNYSQQAGLPPVVFDHWLHRQHYTCRLCHVDIGFGMTAGSTKVRAVDNMKGYFCGACHNGKLNQNKVRVFEACAKEYNRDDYRRCVKCHSIEKNPAKEEAFFQFAARMPRETFGNGIDWEKAEDSGLIKPADYLEGVSSKKAKLKITQDFSLKSKIEGMPDVIFSHRKHTVWNGCELCHPDIFLGIKKGSTKYSMVDLFEGKYCGVCHDKVAFPQTDCQRCHTKSV
jgi:c(7)-type cytochrome triheme protein